MTESMDLERAVRFLVERGAVAPQHNSHVTLLEHVIGTYRVLERWDLEPAVLAAGLFHSVYSTQNFPIALASYDERDAVRAAAGVAGERLAFLFCVKSSDSVYELAEAIVERRSTALELRDWRGGPAHEVTIREVIALMNLIAANAVEQAPRDEATLRRDLPGLGRGWPLLAAAARHEAARRETAAR